VQSHPEVPLEGTRYQHTQCRSERGPARRITAHIERPIIPSGMRTPGAWMLLPRRASAVAYQAARLIDQTDGVSTKCYSCEQSDPGAPLRERVPGVLGDRDRRAVAEALRRLALVLEPGAGAGNRRCDETEPSTAGCGSSPVSQS
jgi:hypothetical protein